MNCCGGHEDHKKGEGHNKGHMEAGGNKTNYLLWGLLGLLVIVFVLRYFKIL